MMEELGNVGLTGLGRCNRRHRKIDPTDGSRATLLDAGCR
ncbi:hypothetical protein R3I93_016942 [Phoxinus phoxinus]|uniref:Uncharacterized protein n=1 Tax=Phoxinus phoxinus TaxID=58324 RepID=A0AAN9CJU8_9TELE